ncbi:MAG: hypothetical protein RIR00_478 [Pseudomonadota bacterium]|jgi:outer membrane protein TolC
MRRLLLLFLCCAGVARAAEAPDLPPAAMVEKLLAAAPEVRAADAGVQAETAQKTRLEAGPHEWSVRYGRSQRRVVTPGEHFAEWEAALERPLRLPAKAGIDAELGAQGVRIAETALGDARHERSRLLLQAWFAWLQAREARQQWQLQVDLLRRQADSVARREQLGDAARLEKLQAAAALTQAEAQLARQTAQQQNREQALHRRFPGIALPAQVAELPPEPVSGDEAGWLQAVLAHSHELALAEQEARRAELGAERSRADQLPDPTLGLRWSQERGGDEKVVGLTLSIPLPGGARRAGSEVAQQHAIALSRQAEAVRQRLGAEIGGLYLDALAAYRNWQGLADSATRLQQLADLQARAYALGEGQLSEVLTARRLANEASLTAQQTRLEARELHYRLQLDAHQLWDFDRD